ncbi:MAG: heavy-metal-associated domain-containing protein [Dehalococcoidia bacterium]|nr:heavy-metal-associated domain-containing protein [Dehalococcoidia bacterium]
MQLRLARLLSYPRTRVVARDGDVTRVAIDGLVCSSVCAVRSRQALARLGGVRRVEVDFERGIASVEGPPVDDAAYQRAIDSVVAGKPLRRALDRLRRSWHARRRGHGAAS